MSKILSHCKEMIHNIDYMKNHWPENNWPVETLETETEKSEKLIQFMNQCTTVPSKTR